MKTKSLFRMTAVASVALMLGALSAEARPGGGRSSGSRGSHTYSAPPSTNTAPSTAQPMQRSTTTPAPGMQQPGMAQRPQATPPAQGSRWGGLGMGLAAGFLGAGLFGLLSGAGFLSGLGSLMGMIGFLFQIALIAGMVFLVMRFLRARREGAQGPMPANARMGGMGSGPMGRGDRMPPQPLAGGPIPGMAGGSVAAQTGPVDKIGVTGADFDMFERRLQEVQDAYSREDLNALRAIATPEMVSYFADDLKANAQRGAVNRISNVKLLQGDLAEAWREQDGDYATVAMRYGLTDVTLERSSGRIIGGEPRGEEVTEVWTFRRPHGGAWQLSAIQQTA
ncbi:Tim44-like domain protein [bacterium YEK0313]|nr:Tim44-like domain protein [bacterium YEK0313]